MAAHRRKFSPQFKAEAVQFVIESGRPVAHVARELQINEATLGNWVKAWREANPQPEEALFCVWVHWTGCVRNSPPREVLETIRRWTLWQSNRAAGLAFRTSRRALGGIYVTGL